MVEKQDHGMGVLQLELHVYLVHSDSKEFMSTTLKFIIMKTTWYQLC
jgi:hypothetical protein